jgi:hypothetical protein
MSIKLSQVISVIEEAGLDIKKTLNVIAQLVEEGSTLAIAIAPFTGTSAAAVTSGATVVKGVATVVETVTTSS